MTILKNIRQWRRGFLLTFFAPAVLAAAMVVACSDSDRTSAPTAPDNGVQSLALGVGQSALGTFLTGPEGRTLYVFTKDAPNTSSCIADCLAVWPPLLARQGQSVSAKAEATGRFGTINTPSGRQVTYNGAPLYHFAPDQQPGETKGHLVGGVWFVARPETASTAVIGVDASGDAPYLVGPTGKSLYFFANDSAGISNCAGQCIANWPALTVPSGQDPTAVDTAKGARSILTRTDDSTRQVTYNGRPLYHFAADTVPGDKKGDGVNGVWTLARP